MIGVVVPACNEEAVLPRCLDALDDQVGDVSLRVVVVCNGCTDGTADLARGWAARRPDAQVIELSEGNKAAAVRAGLAALRGTTVAAVVDADVVVSPEVALGLREALQTTEPRIAAPSLAVDLAGCTWAVRAFYRVWLQEPYVAGGLIGAGVYAVNAAGRRRIEGLPDVIGDDAWARQQFPPQQRCTSGGTFVIRPARTLGALVRRRARVEAGNRQLRAATSGRDGQRVGRSSERGWLRRLRRNGPVDACVFELVERCANRVAEHRRQRGRSGTWSQDQTSRRAS